MDMYTKCVCPKCKTRMLVWLGDWSDCTGVDVEGATCPKCDESFLLGDEFEQPEQLDDIVMKNYRIPDDEEGEWDNFTKVTIKEMVKTLLSGGTWDDKNLSAFLKEYASLEEGEVLR